MAEFKGIFLNMITILSLFFILIIGYFIFWMITTAGPVFLFETGWILIVCEIFFLYIFIFSSRQRISILEDSISIRGIFTNQKVNYSEIRMIEEGSIIIKNAPSGSVGLNPGWGFIRLGNEGITISTSETRVVILKQIFKDSWDEIKRDLEEKSGKKIKSLSSNQKKR